MARLVALAYPLPRRGPRLSGRAAERAALHLVLRVLSVDVGFIHSPLVFAAAMLVGALTSLPGGTAGVMPVAPRRAWRRAR